MKDGSLPLLAPMSEVAGRMATQVVAQCLTHTTGGRGKLLGGVPGVAPAHVVVLGAGSVGVNAARVALGMGAQVTVFDVNIARLRCLDGSLQGRFATAMATPHLIAESVTVADAVIGAVLLPGARAPRLVAEATVAAMLPGSVIVDVAVDQGGCVETIHATSHDAPTYLAHGVVHYAVPNMPGAVPRTSTMALTDVTLPYAQELAGGGLTALTRMPELRGGVNVCRGTLTNAAVADALGLAHAPLERVLGT
jgi:alanine dehydrogenase